MKKRFLFCILLCFIILNSCGKNVSTEYISREIIPEVPFFDAIISYPEFKKYKNLSELIKQDSLDDFNKVVEDSKEWWEEYNQGFKDFFGDEEDSKFGFDVSCNVTENKNYLSILKTTYGFTGGAHGFITLKSYTINKKTKKLVDLPTLVGMDYNEISEYCRDVLKERLLVNSDGEQRELLEENIESGTIPEADFFKIFTVADETVTVFFEQYTVAPYVFGEQTVDFPFVK